MGAGAGRGRAGGVPGAGRGQACEAVRTLSPRPQFQQAGKDPAHSFAVRCRLPNHRNQANHAIRDRATARVVQGPSPTPRYPTTPATASVVYRFY